ncbi:MAG: FUSC family protein [Proteobacteria bacterium]|nr:FUSC family protein [Pseudomonadota bacterium]
MLKFLLEFKPRDVPWVVGLRNTAAVALPLATGVASGHPGIGLGISAGALNTMFSDQPGPYRQRLRRMLLAAGAAGMSAFAGYVLGGNDVAIIVAALVWGIAGGLLVALGPDAGRLGLISMILLVVTSADPRTPAEAAGPALLIFAGGVLLMLFAIAAWPWQRYRPERTALAQTCRQLAASARRHDDPAQAPPVTQALTDVENLLHGRDRARGVAMDAFRVLAELIERIRLELLALGNASANVDATKRATIERLREYAARSLDAISAALDAGAPALTANAALEGFDAALDSLDQAEQGASELVVQAHARALGGQLRAAVRNADFAGSRGELRLATRDAALPRVLRPRNPLAILRSNLHLSSVAFRHALRCGVCLAIAIAGARIAGIGHGYWIPMTCAIVLKPDFAGTFRVGLLRVAGTLLGLVLATALVHVAFDSEWARIVLLAILCFGFRQLTTMHYGLGVMLLTALIVVLLSFEGIAPADTMSARALGTGVGSALALLAYAAWPTWERGRVRAALADLLDAYRQYFIAIVGEDERVRADVRAASRRARSNAQASLDRLRGEPRSTDLLDRAEAVFANANRFLRAAMGLEAMRQHAAALADRTAVDAFSQRVDAALADLAHALRNADRNCADFGLRDAQIALRAVYKKSAAPADAVYAAAWIDASDRIADIVDTLRHLVSRDARAGSR